jgi:hypothetical protein
MGGDFGSGTAAPEIPTPLRSFAMRGFVEDSRVVLGYKELRCLKNRRTEN